MGNWKELSGSIGSFILCWAIVLGSIWAIVEEFFNYDIVFLSKITYVLLVGFLIWLVLHLIIYKIMKSFDITITKRG